MSKKILTLGFMAALAVCTSIWFAAAAQAGPQTDCGNGTTEDPPEDCDDGNTVCADTCSFPSCLFIVCGDGTLNPDSCANEQCDDGNTMAGDGCDANCQEECGNGAVDPGEDCDGPGETATCDDDCTNVVCGDGNLNETSGEECDDGNTVDDATCLADCSLPSVALDKDEQKCVNGINANLAGVSKAQSADNAACLKAAAKDSVANPIASCLGADLKGKVAKAKAKTTKTETKKCDGGTLVNPADGDFAFTDDVTVNAAGMDTKLAAFTAIFGDPPVISPKTEKENSKCQAEVLKRANKLGDTVLKEANKAKKSALKGGKGNPPNPPPAPGPTELGAAIDTALSLATNTKIQKAVNGVTTGVNKKCGAPVVVDTIFDCNASTDTATLITCVTETMLEAACLAIEAADALALDCDFGV
jgi:cysteine-rich repeat protein